MCWINEIKEISPYALNSFLSLFPSKSFALGDSGSEHCWPLLRIKSWMRENNFGRELVHGIQISMFEFKLVGKSIQKKWKSNCVAGRAATQNPARDHFPPPRPTRPRLGAPAPRGQLSGHGSRSSVSPSPVPLPPLSRSLARVLPVRLFTPLACPGRPSRPREPRQLELPTTPVPCRAVGPSTPCLACEPRWRSPEASAPIGPCADAEGRVASIPVLLMAAEP